MSNKHFEIKVEGLKYGKVRKEFNNIDYKTALNLYKETQSRFKKIQCEVVLNRVEVNDETGKKTRKVEYKNYLGKEYSLEAKLEELVKIINEIQEIKSYHEEKSYEGTSDFNDVRHAIENGTAMNLTPEQCKQVFMGISDKAAVRRASKLEMNKYKACAVPLNNIKCQLNKCLDECKKIDKNASTEKAKENAKVSDEKYLNTLLELCEGSVM